MNSPQIQIPAEVSEWLAERPGREVTIRHIPYCTYELNLVSRDSGNQIFGASCRITAECLELGTAEEMKEIGRAIMHAIKLKEQS